MENSRPGLERPEKAEKLAASPVKCMRAGAHQLKRLLRHNCLREFWEWTCCKTVVAPSVERLTMALRGLTSPDESKSDTEAPIFVFASGWRTGSTLLQRILVTDPELLIWGEPLGDLTLIPKLTALVSSVSPFCLRPDLCIDKNFILPSLSTSWIANLYPPNQTFRLALRRFFDQWLGDPARQRGFIRWGIKEVRFGAAEALFLAWLYPRAKFLFLSRDPHDCYRSMVDTGWPDIFYNYPDISVSSATGFGRHWNRLTTSWAELPAGFPAIHIKYEDLISGSYDFRELETWLGIRIREDVALSTVVGHSAARDRLAWYERLIIRHTAAKGMRALGY